jgi:hypothetical protein
METYQSFDQNASAALKVNLSYSQAAGDNKKKAEELNKLFFCRGSGFTIWQILLY